MTPSPESQKRRSAEADTHGSRYDSRGSFKTIQWLLTGLLLVMCLPLLTGRVPTMEDHIWFALPIRQFYADSLSNGASLDWHPHMFGGFFISGEGQLGVYHPLHLAMYSSLPIRVAYALEFALPSFVLVWGAFRFLRLYFDRTSSGFGATLMAFGVYAMYTTHCTNMSGVYCHIPWLLWLQARMFQSEGQRERIACGLGIAGLTGSQILMGYPQIVVMSVITEVLFTLVSMATRRSWVVAPSAILLGKLGGLCIGAVQLLAGLELLPFTNRSLWGEEAMYIFALPPRSLMGLISPPLGFAYLGSVTTVLLVWWMVAPRNQQFWNHQRRSLFLFALLTSITGAWLSLGGHGGLYNLLAKLPVIDKLRVTARFMCMAAIGYAVLSTMAFDLLRARAKAASDAILRREKVVLWFPLATYAVAMVYLAVTDQLPTPRFISSLDYSQRTLDISFFA